MNTNIKRIAPAVLVAGTSLNSLYATKPEKPNIMIILADDMGIDSIASLNDKCKIPTPNIDRLIKQGMLFTDAHSNSAVCSPTRYGILTGRYAWRSRLKKGVVDKWERSLIEKDRMTIPSMLKKQGYTTACIGKWHLGWDWPKKGGGYTSKEAEIDFTRDIGGGPLAAGFEYYYGDDVPNWPPFTWIENNHVKQLPTEKLRFPREYRSNNGIGVKDWKLEAVLPEITDRSVQFIKKNAKKDKPFFLYFAMTGPHTPIAPSKEFQGKSGITRYADYLMEVDACIGKVLKALDDAGITDNTLLFFTADNGTSPVCKFNELRKKGTNIQNHWRGMKSDAFEGGHRVPLVVRWPGKIPAGSVCNQTTSLVDIMATCAETAGVKLPDNAAEDSVSLWPVLKGEKVDAPLHQAVICHSFSGQFIVRKGKWKLLFCPGSGGWSYPNDAKARKLGLPKWQLYDLSTDPKEKKNLLKEHPEIVENMKSILYNFVKNGRSTPGIPQKNDGGKNWWPQIPWKQGE